MARIEGVIMENNHGKAIILTPQGEFQRIKINRSLEVGEFYSGRSISSGKYLLVAAFLLAVTIGTIDFFSVKAYAQVSTSLELGINRWHRVVQVRALDEKGEEILKKSNFTGQRVDEVVEKVLDQALESGNMEEDNLPRVFPVQASDKGNKDGEFIERVEQNMNQGLQKAMAKSKSKADKEKPEKDKSQKEDNQTKK